VQTFVPLQDKSLITYTHVIYALHLTSVLIGVLGAATIIGSFLLGIPSIVGLVMNYARRRDAVGTVLESHFRWQIRTFWWAAGWSLLILAISAPLMLIMVGFLTAPIGLLILGIWVVYRVLRGWTTLRALQPLP
jgi:uncharacterized membrane protein